MRLMLVVFLLTSCGPEKPAAPPPPPPACKWKYLGEEINRVTLQSRHRFRCPERNEEIVTEWE